MKNQYLLLPLLLVFSACGVSQPASDTNTNALPPASFSASLSEALKTGNEKKCDQLTNAGEQQDCRDRVRLALAVQSKNKDVCGQVQDKTLQESCLMTATIGMAVQAGSAEACTTLSDNQATTCADRVYNTLAMNRKDDSLCKKITAEALQKGCQQGLQIQAIVEKGEPEKCVSIQDTAAKTDCYNNAYFSKAVKEKDKSLCKNISLSMQAADCEKAVGG